MTELYRKRKFWKFIRLIFAFLFCLILGFEIHFYVLDDL